jgi:hypothetical protein
VSSIADEHSDNADALHSLLCSGIATLKCLNVVALLLLCFVLWLPGILKALFVFIAGLILFYGARASQLKNNLDHYRTVIGIDDTATHPHDSFWADPRSVIAFHQLLDDPRFLQSARNQRGKLLCHLPKDLNHLCLHG